jgi:hypothetical protein
MQNDPLTGEAQLWNWQAALTLGKNYLDTVRGDAQAYLEHWYDIAASSPLIPDWSWNPRTEYPSRVWDDAFSRYNTGGSIYSSNGNGGVENCSANSAGCTYRTLVNGHLSTKPWL